MSKAKKEAVEAVNFYAKKGVWPKKVSAEAWGIITTTPLTEIVSWGSSR